MDNNYLKLGNLHNIIPSVILNKNLDEIVTSPYYQIASSVVKYLSKKRREDGSIYDNNMGSTLDWQYHMGMYIFSAIYLCKLHKDESLCYNAFKTLTYYIGLPYKIKRGAIDFNNLSLLLSYIILDKNDNRSDLKVLLGNYIYSMTHHASIENPTHANNFITLRALNHLLRFKVTGNEKDLELSKKYINSTLKWQFKDGLFYDYPIDFNYKNGIPQISYHALINMFTLLYGLISNELHLIDLSISGLSSLSKLIANDGEAFYYGRTNNALVGYPCGILSFRIASQIVKDSDSVFNFKHCEEILFQYFLKHHIAEDGHLYITSTRLEDQRSGFDSYMYVSVYNAFTMALFFLASIIKSPNLRKKEYPSDEIHHLDNSGFMVKKGEKLSTVINLKGHNYSGYLLDPRLMCGTPLFIKFKNHDLVPSVPYSRKGYIIQNTGTSGKKLLGKITRLCSILCYGEGYLKNYNPLHAGFLPYLETKTKLYFPIYTEHYCASQNEDGILVLQISGKFIETRKHDFFIILLNIVRQPHRLLDLPDLRELRKLDLNVSNYRFERTILVHDYFIHFYDKILAPNIRKKGFTFRTYADWDYKRNDKKLIFHNEGYGFALLIDEGEILKKRKKLYSSKGEVYYWNFARTKNEDINDEQKNVIMEHTLIPFNNDVSLRDGLAIFKAHKPNNFPLPCTSSICKSTINMSYICHSSWEKRHSEFV